MLKKWMVWVLLLAASRSQALLVVGDDGESAYTTGTGAGSGWDYVGYLQGGDDNGPKPSSVTYVSNGWFVTAQHVWNNEVLGSSQDTLMLGGSSYTISTGTHTSITNASGSAADLCMFRVTDLADLPAGTSVLESTPGRNDDLRLIGNGYDNAGDTGMTWGNGTPRTQGPFVMIDELSDTKIYYSLYDSGTSGSARGDTYDSGGGVFVDGRLAGIMIGAGEQVTAVADFGTYGSQINAQAAIPEPSVVVLMGGVPLVAWFVRRMFVL